MKYMIEIEDEPFGRNDDPVIPHGMDELYRAKGFNSLVFDKNGLDKLIPLDEALEEAYQNGLHAGESKCEYCDEYKRGLDDAWKAIMKIAKMSDRERMIHFGEVWISKILNVYSLEQIFTILEKSEFEPDEIKVGDEVKNTLDFMDNAVGYFFGDSSDGCYKVLRYVDGKFKTGIWNKKDFKRTGKHSDAVVQLLEAMKGEQRDCSTCKHQVASSIECVDCSGFKKWEPKGGDA